jgi:hypothetical protein
MDLQAFEDSLGEGAPPPGLAPALVGLWHALRGEWEEAHDAVQPSDAACSWVHGILHREEGDLPNARYWYRRAERPEGEGDLRDEYRAAAAILLEESA